MLKFLDDSIAIVLEDFSLFETISRVHPEIIILVVIQVPKIKIWKILWSLSFWEWQKYLYMIIFSLASSHGSLNVHSKVWDNFWQLKAL